MQVKTFSTTAIKRNNDHAILAVFMWATGCILPITFCKIYVQSQNRNSHFQVTLLFPACGINKVLVFLLGISNKATWFEYYGWAKSWTR